MTLPVVLSEIARAEFDEAADWLDERYGSGLRFIVRVERVLEQIGRYPELHRLVRNDLRRAIVPKTDYVIYYQVLPDRIEVVSVFHGSRDPEHWQERG